VGCLGQRDRVALQVPSDADLGRGATFGGGDLRDHGVIQDRATLAADRAVALEHNIPLLVEREQLRDVQVGVHLDLVHCGLDLTPSQEVHQHRERAVAHGD